MRDQLLTALGLVRRSRCDYTHARDMEYVRERDAEIERLRAALDDFLLHAPTAAMWAPFGSPVYVAYDESRRRAIAVARTHGEGS